MPEGENMGTPTPTPASTSPHPAFGGPPAASGTSLVQITAEEFQRLTGLKGELDSFRNKYATDLATKEAERLSALAKAGDGEKALEEQRKAWEARYAEAQSSIDKVRGLYHGKAKSEALSAGLSGREFSGETPEQRAESAAQLRSLIESRFETYEDAQGNLIVREKGTGRPAADVLKELADAPGYQKYFAPKSRGGSGTNGTLSAGAGQSPTQPNPDGNPHPVGSHEWAVWRWQQGQQATSKLRLKPKQ